MACIASPAPGAVRCPQKFDSIAQVQPGMCHVNAPFTSAIFALAFGLMGSGCATTHAIVPQLSSSEASSDASWSQFDTNQDGFLSRDELEAQHAVALLRDMHLADRNRNG